jgi:hypothetical protein
MLAKRISEKHATINQLKALHQFEESRKIAEGISVYPFILGKSSVRNKTASIQKRIIFTAKSPDKQKYVRNVFSASVPEHQFSSASKGKFII